LASEGSGPPERQISERKTAREKRFGRIHELLTPGFITRIATGCWRERGSIKRGRRKAKNEKIKKGDDVFARRP